MEKFLKTFNTPIVLIICGTVLAVHGQQTFAITLISLGVLGSIIGFSLKLQKENEEKELSQKMYDDIKSALGSTGIKIPYVTSPGTDQVH